jgi:hypothetical protein
MRANEFLYETIEVICEKTSSDELIPFLKNLGFVVQKKTSNTIKVITPHTLRGTGAERIASTLPGATISDDKKKIHYDGTNILVKPAEAQGGHLEKEEGQIIALNSAIQEHLKGQPNIRLRVGNRIINAAGVNKVPGNVKADAVIIDSTGKEQAWISLKDGSSPLGFGQWGGINHLGRDPEVVQFVQELKAAFPNGLAQRMGTFGKPIKNTNLKALTCFGKDFGGAPGMSNVDLILQGHPVLKKGRNGSYILDGTHSWANGDVPSGEYEPTLMARFGSDRNDFGVKTTRIYSYPNGGRKWSPIPKPAATQQPKKLAVQPKVNPIKQSVVTPTSAQQQLGKPMGAPPGQ